MLLKLLLKVLKVELKTPTERLLMSSNRARRARRAPARFDPLRPVLGRGLS